MSLSILQQHEVHASSVTLGFQPADTSILVLLVSQNNTATPNGCATTWTKVANAPDEWRGVGPFSGASVLLTAGRTPPLVDAVIVEVG